MTKITDERLRAAALKLEQSGKKTASISDVSCGLHVTLTKDALPIARFIYEDKAAGEWRAINILGRMALPLDEVYRIIGVLNEMVEFGQDPHVEAHGLLVEKLIGGWRPSPPKGKVN